MCKKKKEKAHIKGNESKEVNMNKRGNKVKKGGDRKINGDVSWREGIFFSSENGGYRLSYRYVGVKKRLASGDINILTPMKFLK